jgi:uncharacterized membrane protein
MRVSSFNIVLIFLISIVFSFVLFAVPAHAAIIHGTVYDLSLEPMDAFVEINSVPKQFVVAVNGEYSFNVNPGTYVLKANTTEGYSIEPVEIVDDGDYTIDMVIGLDIEDPIDFTDDTDITDITAGITGSSNDSSNNQSNGSIRDPDNWFNPAIFGLAIIVIITIFIIALFVSKSSKEKKKQIDDKKNIGKDADLLDESTVSDIEIRAIALIREHSRITQKELRKMLPYSEAKVSLVIAQLESEGKIKKIKKGRGNILVYVKG